VILGNLFDTLFWDGKYKFTIDLYWAKHKTWHKNFDQNVANSFNFYLTCMKNADSKRLKSKRHVANNRSVHKHSDSPIFLHCEIMLLPVSVSMDILVIPS